MAKRGNPLMPTAVFQITLPAKIKKKRDRFVSSCDVLDINSQGYTEEEAKQNLVQAIKLFFISCYERGTLDEALKECGFQASRAPAKSVRETGFVTVPIPFTTRSHCVRQCRI
jgi:predicted RNase H-like HicB family nuclease